MSSSVGEKELLIFEYNGTARSGKGTVVNYLAKRHRRAAIEETGVDYRAITRALIADGLINAKMSDPAISAKVESFGLESLTQVVASRSVILSQHGTESLYSHDVNELVASVGKAEVARRAVKAGFRKRVETVRDKGEHDILLVDGRDLAKVLSDIAGICLVLRTFVTCTTVEAARRECLRSGIDTHSQKGQAILNSINKRTNSDATRQIDPVKPDPDALDYWRFPAGAEQSSLGGQAVRTGGQIYFDTTAFAEFPDPKGAMCEAANRMFNSALSEVNRQG